MQARQRAARKLRLATGLSLALLWAHGAFAGTFPVFGPENFVRSGGASKFTRSFTVASPSATTYTLHIDNGGLNNQYQRSTSAVVKLNGTVILPTSAFGQTVATIDKPVTLTASNVLDIELKSTQGSGFRLVIFGLDNAAPALTITAPTQPLIVGDNTPTVSVAYSDALAGVDTATLKIAIDGTLLAGCSVGAASATCEPPTLANGSHTVTSEIKDKAGNLSTASFAFNLVPNDSGPPVVQILSPAEGSLIPSASPGITATYFDEITWIDTASVRVLLDGVDRTAEAQVTSSSVSLQPVSPLAEGAHTLVVRVRDFVGNQAEAAVGFATDTGSPALSILEPSGALADVTTTPVRVSYSDAGSGIDLATLSVELDGTELKPSCSVGTAGADCQSPALPAGIHRIHTRVQDLAGNAVTASLSFEITFDGEEPSLSIASPAAPLITGDATPAIRVEYADSRSGMDLASLRVLVDEIDITGGCQVGPSSATCEPPALARGPHTVSAQVADQRGNLATASFAFALTFPLEVAFTEPEPGLLTGVPAVRVTGTVSPQAVSVKVNGMAAELDSGVFTIESLGLHDGVNDLVAVAEDAGGNFGSATVRVVADTTPPVVSLTFPADGAAVATPTVTVAGLVNDLTIGTVSDTQATVTVNGVAATVENRSFVAAGVPLQPGLNFLTAVAEDRAGNQATSEIQVTLEDRTGIASIRGVSGDGQSGLVATELPQPLVVGVTDAAGLPVPSAQVVFRVDQGNGVFFGGERIAVMPTNAQGEASIRLTLGTRAGVGADRVRATAVGITGEVSFVASALTGVPAAIHVASGDNQRGAVAAELSRPLFAVVTDDGDNPVAGVPVTFRVTEGGGGFAESGGADTATAETDESGLASVHLTLGPAPGFDSNLVEATFAGLATLPAVFKQSSHLPGDPADTRISGIVLDNEGAAVPGVTMRLRESALTTVTDAEGKFLLTGVPVGQVFLIADATTATRPGSWASLEFELFNLPGVDNAMPRPIYILPLDLPNGVYVDETRGGTVTVPGVPGVSLEVAPGTVTFPGGSRSGVVSVTAVKADKVPMPPGAGMQPRLIVTIQPGGAHFDPPAPFTLPNVDGLAPGTVTELFSFDHDIGEFVSIGTGTVSQDGLVVKSDPGFGIVEAGWHCGAPPSGSGSSAPLIVRIASPDPAKPLALAIGQTKDIVAQGEPPLDAAYSWKIADPSIATLDPTGDATCNGTTPVSLCPNSTTCTTTVTGVKEGKTQANASLKCCVTGETSPVASIEVIVVKVEVIAVGFVGDHKITKFPNGPVFDDQDGTEPLWKRTGNPDLPVAHTKNTPLRMFAQFKVTPSVTTPIDNVMIRVKSGGTEIGSASGLTIRGSVIDDGSNTDGDVDGIAGSSALPDSDGIKMTTPSFEWEFSLDGGSTWASADSSGPHTMYWTESKPLEPTFTSFNGILPPGVFPPVYDFALDRVTRYVDGNSQIPELIAAGIAREVIYAPALRIQGHPLNAYFTLSGGLCADLAHLMRGLMRTVGVDGTVLFLWGGTDATTMTRYREGSCPLDPIICRDGGPSFRVLRPAKDSAPQDPHFSYHAVVRTTAGGMLHDPSYGLSYPALVFVETAANLTQPPTSLLIQQRTSTAFPPNLNVLNGNPACPH